MLVHLNLYLSIREFQIGGYSEFDEAESRFLQGTQNPLESGTNLRINQFNGIEKGANRAGLQVGFGGDNS